MLQQSPKVSVILCTYNRPYYLGEAIDSVIAQELTEWELLVINDGGRDVGEIVSRYRDPRIRYINNSENKGKAACCNQGLRQAQGRYVAYIDDDDAWYPNHLKVLAAELDRDPALGAAYSDLVSVTYVINPKTKRRYAVEKRLRVSRDFNPWTIFRFNNILHVSLMHTKEAGLRVGGYDRAATVHIDWNITRKLAFCYDIRHVDAITGQYMDSNADSYNYRLKRRINSPDSDFPAPKISEDERLNHKRYQKKSRIILSDAPPRPWPRHASVDFIFVSGRWDKNIFSQLAKMLDQLHYPACVTVYDNGGGLDEATLKKELGPYAQRDYLRIMRSERQRDTGEAFYEAARTSGADFVFLATEKLRMEAVPFRLFSCLRLLEERRAGAVVCAVAREAASPFEVLIKREKFIGEGWAKSTSAHLVLRENRWRKMSFLETERQLVLLNELLRHGIYGRAADLAAGMMKNPAIGAVRPQIVLYAYVKACRSMGKHEDAIEAVSGLISKGFGYGNGALLGTLYEDIGRHEEAARAYSQCLRQIGFSPEDLRDPMFPSKMSFEPDAFTCLMGIGRYHRKKCRHEEAKRMFEMAGGMLVGCAVLSGLPGRASFGVSNPAKAGC